MAVWYLSKEDKMSYHYNFLNISTFLKINNKYWRFLFNSSYYIQTYREIHEYLQEPLQSSFQRLWELYSLTRKIPAKNDESLNLWTIIIRSIKCESIGIVITLTAGVLNHYGESQKDLLLPQNQTTQFW